MSRILTHKLEYNHNADRWACKCGYTLGRDGHEALYARCALAQTAPPPTKPDTKPKPVRPPPPKPPKKAPPTTPRQVYHRPKRTPYIENDIRVKQGALDLFDL
jgi:hypothetical protein